MENQFNEKTNNKSGRILENNLKEKRIIKQLLSDNIFITHTNETFFFIFCCLRDKKGKTHTHINENKIFLP